MKHVRTLQHTFHKHGGQITRITAIEHRAHPPQHGHSSDEWFFVGDVTWDDGTKSEGLEIAPYGLCCRDESQRQEVDGLIEALNKYLSENGTWSEKGKHRGWYANKR